MQITFLGHAGFLVETAQSLVVLDPWLSELGAFDSAWMQLPCNHHLADFVRAQLARTDKARFVYVSHEHGDHFDPAFLRSIPRQDFAVVLPRFRRSALQHAFARHPGPVHLCQDGDTVPLPDGSLRLFLTDAGLNRDSALLVQAEGRTFLDLNDCKVHDRIGAIAREVGTVDVFSAQFSGAIWHPTCYEYDRAQYAALSRRKVMGKFEAVARALEALRPRAYVAAAGPACFLDPSLLHLNFERTNVFPRAAKLFSYLERRLPGAPLAFFEPMPGDESIRRRSRCGRWGGSG
jgi:UDP-MurNAc hydroxylase